MQWIVWVKPGVNLSNIQIKKQKIAVETHPVQRNDKCRCGGVRRGGGRINISRLGLRGLLKGNYRAPMPLKGQTWHLLPSWSRRKAPPPRDNSFSEHAFMWKRPAGAPEFRTSTTFVGFPFSRLTARPFSSAHRNGSMSIVLIAPHFRHCFPGRITWTRRLMGAPTSFRSARFRRLNYGLAS